MKHMRGKGLLDRLPKSCLPWVWTFRFFAEARRQFRVTNRPSRFWYRRLLVICVEGFVDLKGLAFVELFFDPMVVRRILDKARRRSMTLWRIGCAKKAK